MAQVPTPPASRHSSEAPEVQEKETQEGDTSAGLLQTLDILLEQYLHLLDRHQKLQADLAKRLSSGFLSLAHANYTSPPGRRYGVDYYDERMKATRKVSLDTPSSPDTDESTGDTQSNHLSHTFTIETTPNKRDDSEQTEEKEAPHAEPSDTEPPPNDNPTSKEDSEKSAEAEVSSSIPEHPETTPKPKHPRKKFQSSDPITWYGILVPPSLRSAQKSFTEAVDNDLPELATVVAKMRAVEKEVEEVRSQLKSV